MKIWVNGSFDILHIGHIRLLEFASKLGKVRVGVDTDERIKEKKGDTRPFNSLQDRISMLSSIKFVDSIVHFSSDEELESRIRDWESSTIVIGSDYRNKNIIGSHLVEQIIFFDRIPNKSTTQILSYENSSNR